MVLTVGQALVEDFINIDVFNYLVKWGPHCFHLSDEQTEML